MGAGVEAGINVTIRPLSVEDLAQSDEAFFTGTAAEVTPIRELDNREIGEGRRGPITTEIQRRYFDCVKGLDPKHLDWLTFVK